MPEDLSGVHLFDRVPTRFRSSVKSMMAGGQRSFMSSGRTHWAFRSVFARPGGDWAVMDSLVSLIMHDGVPTHALMLGIQTSPWRHPDLLRDDELMILNSDLSSHAFKQQTWWPKDEA